MNNEDILDCITVYNPFKLSRAVNIYRYGSYVYGTNNLKSDFDIIMVSDIEEPYVQFNKHQFNCTAFSVKEFEKRLEELEITMLECIFLPEHMIVRNNHNYSKDIKIDKYKLRRSVSAKASNSFVKAKKKFVVEVDRNIYVGKKSLFHSLRIPMFGKQLAEHGKIVDYSVANHYWPAIRDCAIDDWDYYKKKYKPVFNNIMSDFRKVAPKG